MVQMKKKSEAAPPSGRQKRRMACGSCVACLRKNCGTCMFCRDMRKFGGPCRLKQKCVMRRCLVVSARKKQWSKQPIQDGEETDSVEGDDDWKGWRAGRVEVKPRSLRGRWSSPWGKRLQPRSDGVLLLDQEVQRRTAGGDAEEVRKRRWLKRRRKRKRLGETRAAIDRKSVV